MTAPKLDDLFKEEPLNPILIPYLQKGPLGQSLHHPLVIQVLYVPQLNHICNQQYEHKIAYITKAIKEKDWARVIWMYERPYRLEKFIEIINNNDLTNQEYWKILGEIWSDSENLWQYNFILESLLTANRPSRESMMDEDEKAFLESLPEKFIVYRGHQGKNRLGHSWTLSYWQAKWFSSRFKQKKCGVVQAIVNKKDIVAVLLGRNEFEIVVSPNNLKDIKTVRKINRPDWLETLKVEFERQFNNKRSHHGPWHWEKVEKKRINFSI